MRLHRGLPSRLCRISEPAPNAITNAQTPILNANDAMRIGRNQSEIQNRPFKKLRYRVV